ncbi:MAG: L-fuculose-phosphate aldolase [Anaerolineales bacterium]|nr:L-fuculose-phosphate aldolase [Anaerolineales bacterium]
MLLQEERVLVVEYGLRMLNGGLVKGSGGNISLCNKDKTLLAITPTGIPYDSMEPSDIVILDLDGNQVDGDKAPSSEVAFHLGLVNLRPDIISVVHTHSLYATTVACLGWELPAVHYLIGHAGSSVPLTPYATFGSKELSENILATIGIGNATLLANHGLVAVGETLNEAFSAAEMVEYVSQIYLQARAVGEPVILSQQAMDEVLDKFQTYGQQKSGE